MNDDDYKNINTTHETSVGDNNNIEDDEDEIDDSHSKKMWIVFTQAVPSIFYMMLWIFQNTVSLLYLA